MRSSRARAGRTERLPAASGAGRSHLIVATVVASIVGLIGAACSSTPDGGAVQVAVDAVGSSTTSTSTTASPASAETDDSSTPSDDAEVALPESSDGDGATADDGADTNSNGSDSNTSDSGPTTTAPPAPSPDASPAPDWLGQRVLPTDDAGVVTPQTTPAEFLDRRLITVDILPRPADDAFVWEVSPLDGDPLTRSTWNESCPVTVDDLRYVRTSFWGFDGLHHQGELILHHEVVDDIRTVFAALHEVRFPIEEMRITEPWELDAPPTGDGNNTGAFVCRKVVGGSNTFSQHAYGLAVDINPFHNPYRKGDVVLPELATDYMDRSNVRPGMFFEGGPVVNAFDAIGWGWGGRWQSLDDYHHFSRNNR
ncbi:MAG: M15 family metallopeptidase [Actinomycetota bacterium]